MGVFEDAVIKARDAADFAGKKTGEFVEISKLRISASETEKKINDELCELGRMVYKASKDQTECSEYVTEKAAAIDELYNQVAEINSKINDLKNVKKCGGCSYVNVQEAEYCIKCGNKL